MTQMIHSQISAGISEFKQNPMRTLEAGNGEAVAILNRNSPAFYCVPAELYADMLERIEDLELNAIADERKGGETMRVTLDEL